MKRVVCFAVAICGAGFVIPSPLKAAGNSAHKSDLAQEYLQVRKIALKDPKVQAAYQRAEEKLNDRILEIDPSLKPYVEKRNNPPAPPAHEATGATAKQHAAPRKSAAAVNAHGGPAAGGAVTHVVEKGETLSSIALRYKVSVSSLEKANGITNERKVRAGQRLVIPAGSKSAAAEPKKERSFWDKVKSEF